MKLDFAKRYSIEKNKKRTDLSQISKNFSIEVMPRTAEKIVDFNLILPEGTYVYIAHLEGTPITAMVETATRLVNANFNVVPHFPARLIKNKATLEDWIKRYSDAGIDKALVLAGSPSTPIGEFENSMDLLATELYGKYKFGEIFCAGHPEGNKDIDTNGSDQNLMTALKWKSEFFQQTQIKWSLTTQFCFEVEPIRLWERRLSDEGIKVPINIGVAGPAKLQTMIKYAIMCGVGPSIKVLEKRAKDLTKLLLPYSPAKFLTELSRYINENKNSNIKAVHFFPLGGIQKTTDFLSEINTI